MPDTSEHLRRSVGTLFRELLDGALEQGAGVLNPGDRGLLASLNAVSAEAASARPGGRASIAAHVDHLRYGFSLLNRWAAGEPDPWAAATFASSWERLHVDDSQWRDLRARLAAEAQAWARSSAERRDWNELSTTLVVSSLAHLAYHVGAIRQIDRAAAGPAAAD